MRAGFDERQLAVAVRQRLGGAGQLLFRPGGVAERPVGADLDGLALGVDLAGSLPVLTDGLIGQTRIEGGHERRVVVEYFLHDVLRDIAVETGPCPACAAIDGGQVDRLPVLVADIAVFQPAVERPAVGVAGDGPASVEVAGLAGEQHRGARGEALQHPLLLLADQPEEFVVDGDEGLAFHLLGVVVAQVGGAVGVGDRAAPGRDVVASVRAA